MRALRILGAVLVLSTLATGCGGGASSPSGSGGGASSPAGSGGLQLAIPARNQPGAGSFRLPASAASVQVEVQSLSGGANLVPPVLTTANLSGQTVSLTGIPAGIANLVVQTLDPAGNLLSNNVQSIDIVAGTTAAATVTVNPSILPPPGLIDWWPGDGSGADIQGQNPGSIVGTYGFTTGEVGQCFVGDGSVSCLAIPFSGSLVSTSSFTVEAWVEPTAQVNTQVAIFGQGFGTPQFLLRTGTTGVVPAIQIDTVAGFQSVNSSVEAPINAFSHVAGTFDGTTEKIFVNGQLTGSVTVTAAARPSDAPFDIGGFPAFAGSAITPAFGNQQFLVGLIDEVSYYNRALSAQEILDIFQAGSDGKLKPSI